MIGDHGGGGGGGEEEGYIVVVIVGVKGYTRIMIKWQVQEKYFCWKISVAFGQNLFR